MENEITLEELRQLNYFLDAWDWCNELGIDFSEICPNLNKEFDSNYYQDF